MPPPGYNRSRPHCYVLSLPSGGSYFFQAGTQDLVGEWVSTCNYWSARLSKEPLTGGVSNMDYGWNRVPDADDAEVEVERMSIRSGKSAVSRKSYVGGFASISHNKNDKIFINDWKPPVVPTGASTLSEEAQLASLKKHVAIVHVELDAHNNIRAPMYKLVSLNRLPL
jgi:PH/SEC7 domain-containing protein